MKIKVMKIPTTEYDSICLNTIREWLLDDGIDNETLLKERYNEIMPLFEILCAAYSHIIPDRMNDMNGVLKLLNSEKFFRHIFFVQVTEIETVPQEMDDDIRDNLWGSMMDFLGNRIGGTRHDNLMEEIREEIS